jgi:streptogramin lyase
VNRPDDQVLVRVDAETMRVTETLPMPGIPSWEWGGPGMALGYGSLWVAGTGDSDDRRGRAVVTRVDPGSGNVQAIVDLRGRSGDDVAVAGGSIWVGVDLADESAAVARVDPNTNRVIAEIELRGDYVRRVVAGDGLVVVEELRGGGPPPLFEAIDPATNSIVAVKRGPPTSWVLDIVRWQGRVIGTVAESTVQGFVDMDPQTLVPSDPVGGQSGAFIAPGTDGIWFVGGGDRELGLFDPVAGTVRRFDAPIGTPVALAAEGDQLWVLQFDGKLTRIDLR